LAAIIFVFLLGVCRCDASVISDNPAAWQLMFNDDFSGASLDATKWAHRLPGVRNSAINTSNAVSVDSGLLTIKTYTEAGTNYTGMIGSQGLFQQTYGYFEARMKFHSSAGQWSAFWLTSPSYGNPIGDVGQAGTEIDIVEHRATNSGGTDIRSRYVSAVHWDGYGAEHQQVAKTHGPLASLANDTWHTFGLKWSPTGYEFYYDDALLWTVTQAVSRRSEYLILSSEVRDAHWAGNVPTGGYGSLASSVTNLQVDWVRVWSGKPGDFNGNGAVDAADYVTWRQGAGSIYGGDDFEVWRSHFGEVGGEGTGEAGRSTSEIAVAEPVASVVVWVALCGVGMGLRLRRTGDL
jgi:beta-glucanase (GH16 family)